MILASIFYIQVVSCTMETNALVEPRNSDVNNLPYYRFTTPCRNIAGTKYTNLSPVFLTVTTKHFGGNRYLFSVYYSYFDIPFNIGNGWNYNKNGSFTTGARYNPNTKYFDLDSIPSNSCIKKLNLHLSPNDGSLEGVIWVYSYYQRPQDQSISAERDTFETWMYSW